MSGNDVAFPARIALEEGLELRQLEPADASAIFAVVAANRDHLGRWLPWVESTHDAGDTREFLEQVAENRSRGRTAAYGIWRGEELAGLVGLHDIDAANGTAQIGYWIAERFQGRGLMTRAVQALIRMAFEELGLERIEIRCAAGNLRSQAIPKRLGFTLEGTLRGAQRLGGERVALRVYGLLREEWRRLRAGSAEQV
jgi:ribosomal-protein-serine acetyltransferase